MAWIAVDKNGDEYIYEYKPTKYKTDWSIRGDSFVELPKGSIKKLIGRDLTWDNEAVEIK